MTRWAVIFKDTDGMIPIRADEERWQGHVAFAKAHPELLIGGALRPEPGSKPEGGLWIVEADNRADVVALIAKDPFYVPPHRTYEIFAWGKILEDKAVTL